MPAIGPLFRKGGVDHIDFSNDGLTINGKLAILKFGDAYLSTTAADPDGRFARLRKIADLLKDGLIAEAILATSTSSWPSSEDNHEAVSQFSKANFNSAEPRDEHNQRWSKAGEDEAGSAHLFEEIQYRGRFHDVVVDDLLKGLAANGSKVEKNIKFTSIMGVASIPDGISLSQGLSTPYIIEVKTGADPPFTPNQQYVYPLFCIGNHVTSSDPRLASLGLPVGKPLPPLDVVVFHTSGPGKPISIFDYCKFLGYRG